MNWAFGLLVFILGAGLGYLLRGRFSSSEGDAQTLRRELEQTRFDLSQRQQEMADHFQQSRELMAQLNESWEKANNFLNDSANNLLGETAAPAQEQNKPATTINETLEPTVADPEQDNSEDSAPKDYAKGSSGMLTNKERATTD